MKDFGLKSLQKMRNLSLFGSFTNSLNLPNIYLKTSQQNCCNRFHPTVKISSLIDIILRNNPYIRYCKIIAAELSDRNLTACICKMNSRKYQVDVITCRDFPKYELDGLNRELLNATVKFTIVNHLIPPTLT